MYSECEIEIFTTEIVYKVFLIMISKGVVVQSNRVSMRKGKGKLTFTPKFLNAPETDLIAYYVKSNGEVVSDSTRITLRDRLPNSVS